jgi:hypothetical protein
MEKLDIRRYWNLGDTEHLRDKTLGELDSWSDLNFGKTEPLSDRTLEEAG